MLMKPTPSSLFSNFIEWTRMNTTALSNLAVERHEKLRYLTIRADYISDSGLCERNNPDIVFFFRDVVDELFKLYDSCLLGPKSEICYVRGPPGTGKSIATFVYAMTLISEWIITWLHITGVAHYKVLHFENGVKYSSRIESMSYFNGLMSEVNMQGGKHILIVDGLGCTKLYPHFRNVADLCISWLEKKPDTRRLIFVASLAATYKFKNEDLNCAVIHPPFMVTSWTEAEYRSALSIPTLFASVQKFLEIMGTETELTQDLLIQSKYFIAGGCCRFMFSYSSKQVEDTIKTALQEYPNIHLYLSGITLPEAVYSILTLYKYRFRYIKCIVSEYAATEYALCMGPELISALYQAVRSECNPAFDGWLLELWFFAHIRNRELKCTVKGSLAIFTLPVCAVEQFTPDKDDIKQKLLSSTSLWLKPVKWNQGGYDAVYCNTVKKIIYIVQITRVTSHEFKVKYFVKLLNSFENAFPNIAFEVRIMFVVLEENLQSFQFTSEYDIGNLEKYGINQNNEDKSENIWILGIKDAPAIGR